jgi:hypothetical protein
MVVAGAHENHLFLGCELAVLTMALVRSVAVRGGLTLLTLLQAVNLFGIYGFGLNSLSSAPIVAELGTSYQGPIRDAAAILAIAVCFATLVALMRWFQNHPHALCAQHAMAIAEATT